MTRKMVFDDGLEIEYKPVNIVFMLVNNLFPSEISSYVASLTKKTEKHEVKNQDELNKQMYDFLSDRIVKPVPDVEFFNKIGHSKSTEIFFFILFDNVQNEVQKTKEVKKELNKIQEEIKNGKKSLS